ncbi:MAG: redoxin domain-containing protein [Pirellulales bacterium]|nr:redoxin domain-containing protein [Pirellulales bacterium]
MRTALLLTALAGLSLPALCSRPAAAEEARQTTLGKQIDGFTLDDIWGKEHTLADLADSKAIVVVFLGTECPLARLYAPRINELATEYRDQGVAFLAVDPNRQDSIAEMQNYSRVYNLGVPFLKDTGNALADQFGAERTPEVFVLDAERRIRYRGRIDDQYGLGSSTGYAQSKVRSRFLGDAIDDVLADRDVAAPATEAVGCLIGRVRTPAEDSQVTYSNQIARILQNNCVECHRPGQIAPFALMDYDEVAGWADMIAEVVREQRMPPWHADTRYGHFTNDRSMSEEEKELIFAWVKNGAPEGDRSQLPEPIEYPEGWQIGQPDEIYYMRDEPFPIPAEGTLEYQYFVVDPGWKEDKWIEVTECLLGNRAVVHHIFVFAVPAGVELPSFEGPEKSRGEFNPGTGGIELIAGAAPGTPPWFKPPGMATHVEAGTRLLFQMHYTPNGGATEDRSAIGFRFADPKTVKHDTRMNMAINFAFKIPAGADNHPVEATRTFKEDTLLLTFAPHMHLRGKAFRYELHYPDGKVETLLDVPRYDFNWQVIYMLEQPILAPAGSKLYCLAHFDNSENNLANPNPNEDVRWGDQTWEEMMIGWFSESTDIDPSQLPAGESRTERFVAAVQKEAPRVSTLLKRGAEKATQSDKDLQTFFERLVRVVPQVDRVCVTYVDGEQVRVALAAQPPVVELQLGGPGMTFAKERSALAAHAEARELTIHNQLGKDDAQDLATFAAMVGSSLHLPIVYQGKPATLNFWSKETGAFPSDAVAILRELGELAAAGATAKK